MSLESVTDSAQQTPEERAHMDLPGSVFGFDPQAYHDEFRSKGYVHIKGGVTPEFIRLAREKLEVYQRDRLQFLSEREIKNKKQQYLFEFPEDNLLLRGAMNAVATVTGLSHEMLTLSERHINVYVPNADPNAPAHKDRFASKVSVGLPLYMPKESDLLIYPDQSREINQFESVVDWRNSCSEAELPENVLKDVAPTRLFVDVGDVIIFLGSTIYHGRLNSADAVILYFKFNDMKLDPLGEDPFVSRQRNASLAILARKSGRALLDCVIEVSPRLIRISRHYTRDDWREMVFAEVAAEKPLLLSEEDLALIRSIHGPCAVHELVAKAGVTESKVPEYLERIRRIGKGGGIDFLS